MSHSYSHRPGPEVKTFFVEHGIFSAKKYDNNQLFAEKVLCSAIFRKKDITKTSLFKYTENFTTKKLKFSDKNLDFFLISA